HCAAVPVVFVLAASPVLVLNTIQFHSPFKTGYDFWTPVFSKNHLFFSLRYVPKNAIALWNEFALGPLGYHTANIFGTGTFFVPEDGLLSPCRFLSCLAQRALGIPRVPAITQWASTDRKRGTLFILLTGFSALPTLPRRDISPNC